MRNIYPRINRYSVPDSSKNDKIREQLLRLPALQLKGTRRTFIRYSTDQCYYVIDHLYDKWFIYETLYSRETKKYTNKFLGVSLSFSGINNIILSNEHKHANKTG